MLVASRSRVENSPTWSTTACSGSRPSLLDNELVADAVAVLEQHLQAGEVVVDLVLAADRQPGADEPGARQEERRIDVEDLEDGDRDDDPDDDGDEVVDHPGRRVDALAAAGDTSLGAIDAAVAHCRPPPPRLPTLGAALGHPADHPAQHQAGDAREHERTDDEGGDGGGFHALQYAAQTRPHHATRRRSVGRVGIEPTTREL